MTAGQVITNVVLIALVPLTVLLVYRHERAVARRAMIAGATAAALVVIGLLLVRQRPLISPDLMLVAVVVAEEAAKLLAVATVLRAWNRATPTPPGRATHRTNPAGPVGWSVGAGFASAEHLLYATAGPQVILIRIAGAGLIHVVTARLYSAVLAPALPDRASYSVRRKSSSTSGPRLRRANSTPRPLVVATTTTAGILLHLGYNLLARHLDQIPELW